MEEKKPQEIHTHYHILPSMPMQISRILVLSMELLRRQYEMQIGIINRQKQR